MTETNANREHQPSLGEEIANSLSHGVGLCLAIAATPILIVAAIRYGSAWNTVGVSVFAASMVTLYLASTLYQALTHDRAKQFFRILDHSAIFLLIAVIGLIKKAVFGVRYVWLSLILYLTMGWLAVIAAPQILHRVPLSGLAWILAGGIAYSFGVVFFVAHRIRYAHFAWHLFVLAGTVCHFFAVLWYSA